MGLFQNAIQTFEAMQSLVGVEEAEKEPLAPIGFIIAKAQIKITINADGEFISAEAFDQKIAIPVTEESSGRTAAPAPHPLCDQIIYVSNLNKEKHELYKNLLSSWAEFDPENKKLKAVLLYVKNGTLYSDLKKYNLLKEENGVLKNEKDIICWSVLGLGDNNGDVWSDKSVIDSFMKFYVTISKDTPKQYCSINGELKVMAKQHIKGVVSLNGNAKLVSSNDTINFTFKGRFLDGTEACSVSYEASQKAHNALKWLVANQGVSFGNRMYICWNPNGLEVPKIHSPFARKEVDTPTPTDYKQELKTALSAYSSVLPMNEKVVIAAFDAATTGRLSVSYYNELMSSDFLERLMFWDETCCWINRYGVSTPYLRKIVDCAYGIQRGNDEKSKLETDEKIVKTEMQRLISCRIDKSRIPLDLVKVLFVKAGNLLILNKTNRQEILFVACAVIKKYYYDYFKEECSMSLEPEKRDVSYQYGRLLAVLEKMERDTYQKGEERETNAIKMQSVFVQRPAYAFKIIEDKLNSYKSKLNEGTKIRYEKLIGEIMEIISEFEADYNKPLTEMYLLGYYLQRNALYQKKENETTEDETDE